MAKPLSLDEIMQVLNAEILWCEQNPDKAFHAEYRKGFVNGLIQAKHLIGEVNNSVTGKTVENYRVRAALQPATAQESSEVERNG